MIQQISDAELEIMKPDRENYMGEPVGGDVVL